VKKILLNSNGFSLMEAMMAVGIFSVISVVSNQMVQSVSKSAGRDYEQIDALIEEQLVDSVIIKDIYGANHSFNRLLSPDDNGREFFQYNRYSRNCGKNCDRKITIHSPTIEGEVSDAFSLMVVDNRLGDRVVYDIENAFNLLGGEAIFRGLNNKNILKPTDGKLGDINKNSVWKEDRYIVAYLPVYYEDSKKFPSRFYSFVGRVENDNLVLEDFIHNEKRQIDRTRSNQGNFKSFSNINSLKSFLERSPYVQGVKQHLMLDPIKFVSYYFEAVRNNKGKVNSHLIREVRNKDGHVEKKIISRKITKITFFRDDISSPTIGYESL
jgi:hypothetical protein